MLRNFRSAHSWLRGYSDARAGTYTDPATQADPVAYEAGQLVGARSMRRAV